MMKHKNKYTLLIVIMLLVTIPLTYTFSKYVIDKLGDYIMSSNSFYFNSDKLKASEASYLINNWAGVGDFNIQFELNNRKNNLVNATSDITYEITLTCDSGITCTLNEATTGTLYAADATKNLIVTVTPNRTYAENESANIEIKAKSTSPYVKELSAKFTIRVGKKGISYEIVDQANNPTFNFNITNAKNSYTVNEAFDTYSVGDEIAYDDYKTLSDTNKTKCSSYTVTLTFNPSVVLIDTTSKITTNSTKVYTQVNNVSYISSITFKVDALSSTSIRFYKINTANDYTYPVTNPTSIVSFSAQ